MSVYIIPYKIGSSSAKSLARSLRIKRSKGDKRFKLSTRIINWGNSNLNVSSQRIKVYNNPEAVAIASNKLKCFQTLSRYNVPVVEWTTSKTTAEEWVDENTAVYARQKLSASSADGLVVVQYGDRMPNAPLYTKGFNRSHEYRVHIVNGKVIDYTKKKKRDGTESNSLIKNLDNGWVFCRENVTLPPLVAAASLAAVRCIGLDFGAVDILYREREQQARVLEINTAPGLEGTTLIKYTEEFKKLINS